MGNEFIPTLIQTVVWEAWTWRDLKFEIEKVLPKTPKKLLKMLNHGEDYLISASDLLTDLGHPTNCPGGVVAIRDPKYQEMIVELLNRVL